MRTDKIRCFFYLPAVFARKLLCLRWYALLFVSAIVIVIVMVKITIVIVIVTVIVIFF